MKIHSFMAPALLGLLVFSGCTRSEPLPSTAQIIIEKIDATEEWRPSVVAIPVGGTVIWKNTSLVLVHSVISGEELFVDQKLGGGESFNYTFTKNGTFTYRDELSVSAGMVGTIYVK